MSQGESNANIVLTFTDGRLASPPLRWSRRFRISVIICYVMAATLYSTLKIAAFLFHFQIKMDFYFILCICGCDTDLLLALLCSVFKRMEF